MKNSSGMKLGSIIYKFQKRWASTEEAIWSLLFIAMMVMMFVQVCSRFIFKIAVPWTEEFIRYAFIAGAYIAVGANLIKEGHIEINILGTFFDKIKSVKTRKLLAQIMDIARYGVILFAGIYMFRVEFAYVFKQMSIEAMSTAMHIPMWIMYAIITYGYLSIIIQCVLKIIISLTNHDLIIDKTLLPKEGGEQ